MRNPTIDLNVETLQCHTKHYTKIYLSVSKDYLLISFSPACQRSSLFVRNHAIALFAEWITFTHKVVESRSHDDLDKPPWRTIRKRSQDPSGVPSRDLTEVDVGERAETSVQSWTTTLLLRRDTSAHISRRSISIERISPRWCLLFRAARTVARVVRQARTPRPIGKWVDTHNCLIVQRGLCAAFTYVSTKMKTPNLRIGPCLNDPIRSIQFFSFVNFRRKSRQNPRWTVTFSVGKFLAIFTRFNALCLDKSFVVLTAKNLINSCQATLVVY